MSERPIVKVLLVEDDPAEAISIKKMLAESVDVDFRVDRCEYLRSALTIVHAKDPDVVLLDLSLPDAQGYDTVTEYAKHADTPFIVLTGHDNIEMAMRTIGLGAQDYIVKSTMGPRMLEMAIMFATRRANREDVSRRLEHSSRAYILGDDPERASLSMVRPLVSELIAAHEAIVTYLQRNAPQVMDDIRAIMDKHGVENAVKEARHIMQLSAPPSRKRAMSDEAFNAVAKVMRKRIPTSDLPDDYASAEAGLLGVLSKRRAHDD